MARSVCIVSPGNLAANPRILKEAGALHEAGYAVTAVVSDYSTGLRGFDAEIAGRVPWKVVRTLRSSAERYVSAAARLAARVTDELGEQSSPAIAARAYGGPIGPLQRAAMAVPADLYIGHYIAGLHAAGVAAQRHQALLGFDAEDFHPGEERDDLRTEIVRVVEAEWLVRCRHFTAAAPLIGKAYAERYGLAQPATVLNVFPLGMAPRQAAAPRHADTPLRTYWFSQTIGLDRGLQPFLQGMAQARTRVELELRGDDRWGHGATLLAMARELGIGNRLKLLPMAAPEEMVQLAAAYDLGLSLETDVSENRQLCLTNKIFTYLLAGVPVVMSDTPAQRQLAPDLGGAAALVSLSDPPAIAAAIDRLAAGLDAAKAHAAKLGRERYNWDVEKKTLLASVDRAFAEGSCQR
jgi:glycosyltransferase involved in cell wall biosynthesis